MASCQKYEQRKDNAQWEGSAAFFDDDDDDSTDDAGDDEMTEIQAMWSKKLFVFSWLWQSESKDSG